MYRTKAAVAVTLAGVLLAGCSSDGGGGSDTSTGDKDSGATTSSFATLTVPSAYASAKGWDQELDWVPENTKSPVPVTTDGNSVAYILRSADGYTVQARDGSTGKVQWTSARYQIPAAITDEPNLGYFEESPEIPQVTVVQQEGHTYLAAWAHGTKKVNGLTESQDVVQIDLYAMDSSGSSVAPLRRVSVPVGVSGHSRSRSMTVGAMPVWSCPGRSPPEISAPLSMSRPARSPLTTTRAALSQSVPRRACMAMWSPSLPREQWEPTRWAASVSRRMGIPGHRTQGRRPGKEVKRRVRQWSLRGR